MKRNALIWACSLLVFLSTPLVPAYNKIEIVPSMLNSLESQPYLAYNSSQLLVSVEGALGQAAPILLYHHVSLEEPPSRYSVTKEQFHLQVRHMRKWGYTALTISQLSTALRNGQLLPERPVVITFDDGNADIYWNALPILYEAGYPAVVYLIADMLGGEGFLSVEQVHSLAAVGWEVGSHSKSHIDLRGKPDVWRVEIAQSRRMLVDRLGIPIFSFSYPYGLATAGVLRFVRESEYTSAVGLGGDIHHRPQDLFYLQRIEVDGRWNLAQFSKALPWKHTPRREEIRLQRDK